MIDAKRDSVFAGIYDNELNCVKKDKLISIKELSNLNSDYEFVSYDDIKIDNVVKPNINIIKIIKKHINDESINPHNLNPNYLKLTEAEESRKNKLEND